jgi:hypothetical protein
MAACNVNSFHITGGWHLGHDVIVTIDRNGDYYIVSTRSTQGYEKLNDYIRSFLFYNGGSELGKRVRFWKEEK